MHTDGFPLLPHELTGIECPGMIVPGVSGNTAEFACNECHMIIGALDAAYVRELASLISAGKLELSCPHCGASNSFPELDAVDAFICVVCGKPVKAV